MAPRKKAEPKVPATKKEPRPGLEKPVDPNAPTEREQALINQIQALRAQVQGIALQLQGIVKTITGQ